jgi:hypothetical protein
VTAGVRSLTASAIALSGPSVSTGGRRAARMRSRATRRAERREDGLAEAQGSPKGPPGDESTRHSGQLRVGSC